MFEAIKSLRPHFHSLREVSNNVSLDIKLPLNWRYDEVAKPYRSVEVKIQDKNERFTLVSLISKATQDGYDVVLACAVEIIKINIEEEEKRKLFQERQKRLQEEYQSKVKELEERFKSEPLDKLKDINLLKEDGQEDNTSNGLAEQGSAEGSEGVGDTEEDDD